MRLEALRIMGILRLFRPRLIGSILTGHCPVDLARMLRKPWPGGLAPVFTAHPADYNRAHRASNATGILL